MSSTLKVTVTSSLAPGSRVWVLAKPMRLAEAFSMPPLV